jgi:hypothetical protein
MNAVTWQGKRTVEFGDDPSPYASTLSRLTTSAVRRPGGVGRSS